MGKGYTHSTRNPSCSYGLAPGRLKRRSHYIRRACGNSARIVVIKLTESNDAVHVPGALPRVRAHAAWTSSLFSMSYSGYVRILCRNT